jgi:L-cystine transport system permease protein
MMNNNPLFSWQDIAGIVPKLLENLPVTLGITLASLLLGLTIALLIVLLQFSRFKPLSAAANGYTDILRGAPLALLILLFFFGGKLILTALALPPLWISDTTFAVLSISVSISPYFAEMMRSAWRAVDSGQKEAIISLNIPWHQGIRRIIFPGLIIAIPVFGNLLINLVKMTSLVNIIGIVDVFGGHKRFRKIATGLNKSRHLLALLSSTGC